MKEGAAWKASVESIIALQAVTFALGDLMLLPTAERPLAVDRAGVLLARHEEALQAAWQGQDVPAAVAEVLADATAAYQAAKALLSRQ
ncbi:MAG: hypothetical protein KDA20_10635 [Phycisphaerales bacterium]|nr:hypothetical protein [Phycisphaerales bacterium]